MSDQTQPDKQAQLLAGVLDSSLDGIYAFQSDRDEQGRIVDFVFVVVNRAAERLVGQAADQLLGRRMLEVLPGNKADGLFDAYARVVETGAPFIAEHYYEHDGLASWFRISATRCGDGFTVSFADITDRRTADAQLKLANERLHLMVTGSASGVWDWHCRTDEVYYSARFEEIIGYGPGELEPTLEAFTSRLHPDDRDRIWAQVEQHLQERMPYDVEYRLRHKQGHYVWCHAAGQAQWDDRDKPVRMAGSIADISERKAHEQEIRKLSMVASRTDHAVIVTDAGGKIEWVNRAFTKITGYTMDEVLGKKPGWVLQGRDTDPQAVERIRRNLSKGHGFHEMLLNYRKGGEPFWNDIEVQPIRNESGTVVNYMAIERDVTERLARERELVEARDLAQKASASKSAFVANMSHEIRTPMNAILGYADLLLDTDQTEPDKRNHAQTIRRNGYHLMGILNDVLDISKIEAGKMSIERVACNPDQLFANVITLMMPRAMEKGIGLDFRAEDPLPDRVCTDPTRVRQVLLNLVGNAIKFTHTGSVHVVVRSRPDDDGGLEVACDVVDTGIGIAPDKVAGLFSAFSQADESTTRKFGGTGLGLTISKNLCEMLGGDLTCTSTPGEGSTFTARFRMGSADKEPETEDRSRPPALATDKPLAGKRVLVVEDGPDNQRLIRHYLTKSGAETEVAENGAVGRDAALGALNAGKPFHAVLMDMQMPVLDGYAATRQLREQGYSLPIIALTAHASANDREACLDAGCTDYLTKPIGRHKLVHQIALHIDAQVEHGAGI